MLAPLNASPNPERLGNLQDTALRKLLTYLPFGRAVYLRPSELHALGDGALEARFDRLADHRPLKLSKGTRRQPTSRSPRLGTNRAVGSTAGRWPACCTADRKRRIARRGYSITSSARPDVRRLRGTGRYGISIRLPRQSAVMLAARITLPHFSVSSTINFPTAADVIDIGSTPKPASRAFMVGSVVTALISLSSLSITSAGVPFGAPTPYHWLIS